MYQDGYYQEINILHKTYSRLRHILEKLMSKIQDNVTRRAICEIGEKVIFCQAEVFSLIVCRQNNFPPKIASLICTNLARAKSERRHWLKAAQRQKKYARQSGLKDIPYLLCRRIISC